MRFGGKINQSVVRFAMTACRCPHRSRIGGVVTIGGTPSHPYRKSTKLVGAVKHFRSPRSMKCFFRIFTSLTSP